MSKVTTPVKKKKKTKNYYFNIGTEKAIIRYNNTDDARLKNKIYTEHIAYAFDKLAENIKSVTVAKDKQNGVPQEHEDPVLEHKHQDLFDELFGDKS